MNSKIRSAAVAVWVLMLGTLLAGEALGVELGGLGLIVAYVGMMSVAWCADEVRKQP